MIELKIVEGQDLKRWNNIVRESPYDTIFHILGWIELLDVKGDLNGKK